MPMTITDECIVCNACQYECTNACIYYDDGEDLYVIEPENCETCGECASVCPINCITPA